MVGVLADENMMRLFSDKWKHIKDRLIAMGYLIYRLPDYLLGKAITDKRIIEYIKTMDFDGIITEDRDFVETHRSPLLWDMAKSGKIVLLVIRNPSSASRYEVIIEEYKPMIVAGKLQVRKKEILREIVG